MIEPITTAVQEITIDSNRILHHTEADLVERRLPNVIRIVQYDTLPVIAVDLKAGGVNYTLPSGAACNIRIKKPDDTVVYNPALGCDNTRKLVYFEVTQQMATVAGELAATVEVITSGKVAGTSPLRIIVDRNPVSEDAIESGDEFKSLAEYVEEAESAADVSQAWATGAVDGTDVESTDPQYHNNSKYWAEQASDEKEDAEAWSKGTKDGVAVSSSAPQYNNHSKYFKEESEAWAKGTKNGTPVDLSAEQYHDNAKYYADLAQEIADSIPSDYTTLTKQIMLEESEIPDTVQAISFDSAGNVSSITHTSGNTTVRTDAFTFGTNTITEVRTLSTGETLTIVTNTTTLQTTITYSSAA